ncbi:hypothetical protein M404DRAFT_991550 [Pisolithus tinctorius Marx 270]|uniref:Uncharacterized protein n=1 Tax=Pisolithus tinctorius Marx 270 TaxID=870435 RepID=A0A0C3KZ93_PISTI|nr:hypothetical protein M404DRAFT_991550 [Pisolithus tinctorius Marx 270]
MKTRHRRAALPRLQDCFKGRSTRDEVPTLMRELTMSQACISASKHGDENGVAHTRGRLS